MQRKLKRTQAAAQRGKQKGGFRVMTRSFIHFCAFVSLSVGCHSVMADPTPAEPQDVIDCNKARDLTKNGSNQPPEEYLACPEQAEIFGSGQVRSYVVFFPNLSATVSAKMRDGLREGAALCASRGEAKVKGYASAKLDAVARARLASARAENVVTELKGMGCRSSVAGESSRSSRERGGFPNDKLNDRAVVTVFTE